jgi:hypothetical protein
MASLRSANFFFVWSASKLANKFASFRGGVLASAPSTAGRADARFGRFVAIARGFYTMNQDRAIGKKGGKP